MDTRFYSCKFLVRKLKAWNHGNIQDDEKYRNDRQENVEDVFIQTTPAVWFVMWWVKVNNGRLRAQPALTESGRCRQPYRPWLWSPGTNTNTHGFSWKNWYKQDQVMFVTRSSVESHRPQVTVWSTDSNMQVFTSNCTATTIHRTWYLLMCIIMNYFLFRNRITE